MIAYISQPGLSDYRQYATWLIAIFLVAFGFRYAREIISFILDKLYEFFIAHNNLGA
ncbi:MAG: hypothetical protein ACXVMS_09705 [Flavisolibacter sp.]